MNPCGPALPSGTSHSMRGHMVPVLTAGKPPSATHRAGACGMVPWIARPCTDRIDAQSLLPGLDGGRSN